MRKGSGKKREREKERKIETHQVAAWMGPDTIPDMIVMAEKPGSRGLCTPPVTPTLNPMPKNTARHRICMELTSEPLWR